MAHSETERTNTVGQRTGIVAGSRAPVNRTPKSASTARDSIELSIAQFLHSFQTLQAATRLYQKDHPLIYSALESAESQLRAALSRVPAVVVGLEEGALVYCPAKHADPLPLESKEAWAATAKNWARCDISSLQFLPQTNLGELDEMARLMNAAGPADSSAWPRRLGEHRIFGIRVNAPLRHRAGSILATLVSALLLHGGVDAETQQPPAATPANFEDLTAALRLLARFESIVSHTAHNTPKQTADTLHMALADAERRTIHQLVRAMSCHPLRECETGEKYLARIAESLLMETFSAQFLAGGIPVTEIKGLFATLLDSLTAAMSAAGSANEPSAGERSSSTALAKAARALLLIPRQRETGAAEAFVEQLHEQFWNELPARERSAVLRGPDAWCVPVPVLRQYIEQLRSASKDSGGDAPVRESRILLANYARALEAEKGRARRTAANGLVELLPLIADLWLKESPVELDRTALRALLNEPSPGIAGVLAGLVEKLTCLAGRRGDFKEFERILAALENSPRDKEHSHLTALGARLMEEPNWKLMLDRALDPRSAGLAGSAEAIDVGGSAVARLLARNPERLVAALGGLLAAPDGLELLGVMSRLVSTAGEPVLGALESHLLDPRHQRAATAIKLLGIAEPARLLERLPRALAAWDWTLQDLAIAELSRLSATEKPAGVAAVFATLLPEAHPLVVPVMLDEIGAAGEKSAIPLLCEIAAGTLESLRDVFIRIKAIEALGRMHAAEAANVLRALLRERQGLVYLEPAGLRIAAKEALALIENHPSSARVRATERALVKANISHRRPRRYFRIPLDRPYKARIEFRAEEGNQPRIVASRRHPVGAVAARVSTISMGGAFLEAGHGLSVGDQIGVEIRAGFRHIRSTAIVRNVSASGGGVEFLHLSGDNREKLRRLIQRLLA